ncbi:hypothetical protein L195_g026937, partial [Trifolium pratense]
RFIVALILIVFTILKIEEDEGDDVGKVLQFCSTAAGTPNSGNGGHTAEVISGIEAAGELAPIVEINSSTRERNGELDLVFVSRFGAVVVGACYKNSEILSISIAMQLWLNAQGLCSVPNYLANRSFKSYHFHALTNGGLCFIPVWPTILKARMGVCVLYQYGRLYSRLLGYSILPDGTSMLIPLY